MSELVSLFWYFNTSPGISVQVLWVPLPPAIACVTSPKCHFQAPSHPVTVEQHWGSYGISGQIQGRGCQNVFRYVFETIYKIGSSIHALLLQTQPKTQQMKCQYQSLLQGFYFIWERSPGPRLDWLWLNKWCQGIDYLSATHVRCEGARQSIW